MGNKLLELFYHLVCFFFYSYVMLFEIPFLLGYMDTYLGQHKFLTIHCLYFQVFYYCCATLIDITFFKSGGKSNTYGSRYYRDYFFSSLIFPITSTVSIAFWSVYWVDRKSVCPPQDPECFVDYVFSNHALHTAPIFTSLLESLVVYHKAQWGFLKGIMGWMIYISFYISLVYWIATVQGFWVYPFLSKLSVVNRALFLFGGFGLFGMIAYLVGISIVRNMWLTNASDNRHSKKKPE